MTAPSASARPITAGVRAARRFLCSALGLDAPHRDVAAALRHHGFVQLDPINVCGRMHDLILRNRVAGYRENDLLRHLHGPGLDGGPTLPPSRRAAFEHHLPGSGVLAAFPLDAWPVLVPTMEERSRQRGGWGGRLRAEEERLARRILAEIEERGPLTADDIAHDGRTVTAWGSRGRLSRAVLDKLFLHGRVLIASRRGFRRVYDLTARVLPGQVLEAPRPAPAELARRLLLLRLRQRRLATLRRAEAALLGDRVREVRIEGCPPCFCLSEDAPALEAAAESAPRDAPHLLLAPLDPLIYDRRLTAALWGFEYTWEVYTPAAKRVRGYYALPVLARERLAGHVEPRADRERRRLVIVSRNVKHGVALRPALRELARFLGLRAIAAALLALALQGCPSSPPAPEPDALRVATYQDFAEQVRAALAPWARDHPQVRLQLLALPPNELVAALSARLATGVDAPDLLVVDASLLARLGSAGALADLSRPPHDAALDERTWPALAAEGRLGQAQIGVPADAAPALLLYRPDLLARAGVTEAELAASWEGFVSACARVRTATGAYCLSTLRDLSEAALRTGLRDGESPYFSAADEPFPDAAGAARAMRLAAAAHAAEIEAGVPTGSEGWADLVRAGRIAVQMGGPTTIRRLARLEGGSNGRWRAAPLPGGAAVSAPSAFCALAARGARLALAFDLLRGACLAPGAAVEAYREAGAFPALVATARDPALGEPVALLGGQIPGPLLREATSKLPSVRAHRLDGLASDAFALEVDRVVQNGKDVHAALADARAEVERRVRRQR